MVSLGDLVPAPYNPRRMTAAEEKHLTESVRSFGLVDPLIVNRNAGRKNVVIGGHQRLRIARKLGINSVPVVYVSLEEARERELNLRLNKNLGEWDFDLLAQFERGLLERVGFDEKELAKLFPAEIVEDEAPPLPTEPTTRPGDLYTLGDHRLLCGDATKRDDAERLLAGASAAVCLTDPPYGVGKVAASGKNAYSQFVDDSGVVASMAKVWVPMARELCSSVVFSPGLQSISIYPPPAWVICWFYGGGQFKVPWGFNCWQPFLCYGKDPSLAGGHGSRPDAVDLNVPANSQDIDHPCPKPLKLWAWLVNRLTFGPDEAIYDPFSGSGTTAIACEQLGRRCYMLEIDPRYCDVIVARWEKLTGRKAERARG